MDKLDNALETLQQSIDKHSQHVATSYQANACASAAANGAAMNRYFGQHSHSINNPGPFSAAVWAADVAEVFASAKKRTIEEYAARHRPFGYQWFLEVSNADDLLEHEEFCQSDACAEGSVGKLNADERFMLSSDSQQKYWRAFKNKQDAAAFMLTFEATNLFPEVDLNETDW